MSEVRIQRSVRLTSSPGVLWPLLSNTNRLNRSMGVPENSVVRGDAGHERLVSARLLGMTFRWRESPFEYVEGRYYTLVREFENGPLRRMTGTMRLEPDGAGTRVVLDGTFSGRPPYPQALLRVIGENRVDGLLEVYRKIDASILPSGECGCLPRTASQTDLPLLSSRAKALEASATDPAAAARLVEHLRSSPDDEVARFRPFVLADRWGMPRLAVLCACLHAVKAGLLDLSWEIMCPNCGSAPETVGGLSGLKKTSHCGGCKIDYGVGFDESVELRFSVHPSVRRAEVGVFCAGSPAHSPQAVAQSPLAPGKPKILDLDLDSRTYRLRGLCEKCSVLLVPRADAPSELNVNLSDASKPKEMFFKPGEVRLRLSADEPELARVERESWKDAGATAALVTSLNEFRCLFSSEVLSPGLEIGVKRLALLFTDLKGSTAMYERVGDATAYGVVRDHFDYLTAIIAARRGAVVKTIGDAVMAVFSSGADAVEAALDMQERIAELDAKLAPRAPVVLKIGVHEGAAIAINAGGVLDYFGTTANVAARVQNESAGGDVVISDGMRSDPAIRAVLDRRTPGEEPFESELKGLSGVQRLWRLRVRAGQ
ncbi:MAG: SRPBCC family protein [Elusimicrobia bacterium]|nr:SRPBCC family protein [Elusimicrobiota bacterium]